MKNLVHQSGKMFVVNGDSKSSKTARGIVSAHISNFFNKNKSTIKGNPDTQSGFIKDRFDKNQMVCKSFMEAREATINEFELIYI
jgi:hypothetical protein